jgi:hypothetical protein
MFSRIVTATFCDFIHNFLKVYLDDWTMYILLKENIGLLRLMLDRCKQLHIYLNLRKCICCVPFRNILGHIVCREGVLFDSKKVGVILNMPPPTTIKQMWNTLGHIGYYLKFIRNYVSITTPLK